ncbi:histone deacetylase [Candidatus Poribacteria bacterium]|nr:histone deacetylase [Candidatus Poribacteria bacterium]
MPQKTAFVYHPDYLNHDTGPGHPERPDRLRASLAALQQSEVWEQLHYIDPTPATVEQIAYAHKPGYSEYIRQSCEAEIPMAYDTPVGHESYDIALLSTGGVLCAAEAVATNQVKNAFAMVRPPGHHATPGQSMGFCLFNNIAVTARYLQREHGVGKVAIVDWDVHHGNGTQDIFYEDESVFFFSIHQSPLYPGTGSKYEQGSGDAKGTTLNVPMSPGSGNDEYKAVFEDVLGPALQEFSPEFILISAGFDAHYLDPLSNTNITAEGFAMLTDLVLTIAEDTASDNVVSALEGGYSLEGVSESVVAHVECLGHSTHYLKVGACASYS